MRHVGARREGDAMTCAGDGVTAGGGDKAGNEGRMGWRSKKGVGDAADVRGRDEGSGVAVHESDVGERRRRRRLEDEKSVEL